MGDGDGRGATINLPPPAGCGDAAYLAAFDTVVLPALDRFRPQLLFVSAGFDAHWRDPLAMQQLSGAGYRAMAERLHALAQRRHCGQLYVLEGGYDLDAIAWATRHCVDVLLGNPPAADPVGPAPAPTLDPAAIASLIDTARRLHNL